MNIIVSYRWVIVIITIAAVVSSLVFSYLKPVSYDTSISFSINRINKQETLEYQYDGYYAIQAADLFSQTVMSWLMTPSVLLEIYEKANIDPHISSIENLTSRFKAKKYSPQNIVVRYKERDYQSAEKIAQAITSIVEDKAVVSNQTSDQKALFEVNGAKPVIVEDKPIIWLNVLIGLVSGLVLSIIAAYIIEYFRRGSVKERSQI